MAVYLSTRQCARCVSAQFRSLLLPQCNAVYSPGPAWPVVQPQRCANTIFKRIKADRNSVDNVQKIRYNKMLRLAIRDADGAADLEKNEAVAAAIKLCSRVYTKAEIKKILLNDSLYSLPETTMFLQRQIDGLQVVIVYRAKNFSIAKGVLNRAMTKADYKMDIAKGKHPEFMKKGFVYVELPIEGKTLDEEDSLTLAIEVGAEEVEDIGGCLKFTCQSTAVSGVVKQLGLRDIKPSSYSVDYVCLDPLEVPKDKKKDLDNFIEKLEYVSKYGPEGYELIQVTTNVADEESE